MGENEVITVRLSKEVKEAWEALAERGGWNLSKLIGFVLTQFIKQDGTVYTGKWLEKGEEKGKRVVIEWPTYPSTITKAGIMKVPFEEMV
ncbi:MAG: hypothetical protein ACTSP1_07065 [Candidatus Freyarchaeota archaeon]